MRQRRERRAFTLIELLVVIAIIAMLTSIIVPALAKAKQRAKAVVCAAGMKQIAVAFKAYGLENREHILMASTSVMSSSDDTNDPWFWALLPYIGGDTSTEESLERPDDLWFCPADKDPYPQGYSPHGQEYTSYALNGYYQAAASGSGRGSSTPELRFGPAGGYRYTQIKQSSGCMLMMETSYSGQVYDCDDEELGRYAESTGHHRNTSGFYHDGWMNVIYVDGHVDHVKGQDAEEVEPPSTITSGGYMFWPDLSLPDSEENGTFWGPGY